MKGNRGEGHPILRQVGKSREPGSNVGIVDTHNEGSYAPKSMPNAELLRGVDNPDARKIMDGSVIETVMTGEAGVAKLPGASETVSPPKKPSAKVAVRMKAKDSHGSKGGESGFCSLGCTQVIREMNFNKGKAGSWEKMTDDVGILVFQR